MIPALEHNCCSWIVVSRETGKPMLETFERRTAEAINQDKYAVLTAVQWLRRFNRLVREGKRAMMPAAGRSIGGIARPPQDF